MILPVLNRGGPGAMGELQRSWPTGEGDRRPFTLSSTNRLKMGCVRLAQIGRWKGVGLYRWGIYFHNKHARSLYIGQIFAMTDEDDNPDAPPYRRMMEEQRMIEEERARKGLNVETARKLA